MLLRQIIVHSLPSFSRSKEFELKQRRIEREEARAHHKEELFELRRKEIRQEEQRNRLDEQRNMMFQMAMMGIMAYLGMRKDGDKKRPGNAE